MLLPAPARKVNLVFYAKHSGDDVLNLWPLKAANLYKKRTFIMFTTVSIIAILIGLLLPAVQR